MSAEHLTQGTELDLGARLGREPLAAFLASFADYLFVIDPDGCYVFANRSLLDIWGLTAEQAVGRSMDELGYPVDVQERLLGGLRRVLDTGERVSVETHFRDVDGTVVYHETVLTPLRDAAGEIVLVSGSSRETTKRKQLEAALREAEARSLDLIRHAPTGILEFDFDPPRLTNVNEAICSFSGYSREELLGMDALGLLDDVSRARFQERAQRWMAGESLPSEVEYCAIKKNGTELHLALQVRLVRSEDGTPTGAFVIAHDVTERRRAEEGLKRELANVRLLVDAATALSSGQSLHEVLNVLCSTVLGAVDHQRVAVSLFDETESVVRTAASGGLQPAPIGVAMQIGELPAAAKMALAQKRTILADCDVVPFGERDHSSLMAAGHSLHVPLIFNERVVGLLAVDDVDPRSDFTVGEVTIAEGLAAHAAVAIENARLLEVERGRASRLEALSEAGALAAASLESSRVIEATLESARKHLGVVASTVWTLDRSKRRLAVAGVSGFPRTFIDDFAAGIGVEEPFPVARAVVEAAPVVYPRVSPDAQLHGPVAETYARYGISLGALAAVPLISNGAVIGGLTLAWEEPRRFSPEDTAFIGTLVGRFSDAIEKALMYESERRIADQLQTALLSLPDRLPGVEIAHAYYGASDAARVGGDFYDAFELDGDRLGVTVGDVAGKGLDAAVLTSLAKNTIRAHAAEPGKSPAQVLAVTNDVIYKTTTPEAFVTVFFGVLDCRDGRFVYSNAGHTTTAIIRRDGGVSRLPVNGPLLGGFPNVDFGQREAMLSAGDALFLYTDGVTEARRDGQLYGEERLLAFLDSVRVSAPTELVEEVLSDVLAFSGGQLNDDVAMIALEIGERPAGGPQQQRLPLE